MSSIFNIIGPVMVGPSSSHTVGALRLARVASKIKGEFDLVNIILYGSFADTGAGHGTDLAIIAGLLKMNEDDVRIRKSFDYVDEKMWKYTFKRSETDEGKHPNTVRFEFFHKDEKFSVEGKSIGGGDVIITEINKTPISASIKCPTLVTKQDDKPGSIATVLNVLSDEKVNVSKIVCWREIKNSKAISIIELEHGLSDKVVKKIEKLDNVEWARYIDEQWDVTE